MNRRPWCLGSLWRQGHAFAVVVATVWLGATGCGHTQKNLLFDQSIDLPPGRFVGPVELEVPRRPPDSLRDFEIVAELTAACGPLLRMTFPDGEVANIGDGAKKWQELQSRRATQGETGTGTATATAAAAGTATGAATATAAATGTATAAGTAPETRTETATATAAATAAETAAETAGAAGNGPPGTIAAGAAVSLDRGHWTEVTTESWPGQLEFLRLRDARCGARKRYARTYRTAYDESGRITVWAEVPQELADATLRVRVFEIIDAKKERRARSKAEAAVRAAERQRHAELRASVTVTAPPKPRPPMPPPKRESPKPAEAEGAIWTPGQWAWSSTGKWVWVGGQWGAPARAPASPPEHPAPPPVTGCRWRGGHWEWVPGPGRWSWVPGHWTAPPPKVENPGKPPVPESAWIDGRWISVGASFEWIPGRWGRPSLRAETIPPPPNPGAQWRAGTWMMLRGQWIWSPGFYEGSHKAPPPRRAETPTLSPRADAVWLAGFWRWDPAQGDYAWVAGHWEVPPGQGYVWVADPPDPALGYSIGGEWRLRVEIDVKVPVKIEVRP